jgi:DNA replication protein DnaC
MKRTFPLYRDKTLDDFQVSNGSQAAAFSKVTAYVKELEEARAIGRGLTFLGPVGVGKTHLASAVLNEASHHEPPYRIESIEEGKYVGLIKHQFTLTQLLRELHDDDTAEKLESTDNHIREIQGITRRSAEFVLFDDVGREHPSESGWSQGEFLEVVRGRWNRRLPTIITTNLTWDELTNRYTDSLTSVLKESSTLISIEADDYR